MSSNELQDYTCAICLQPVQECVRCVNRHLCCARCAGEWALGPFGRVRDDLTTAASLNLPIQITATATSFSSNPLRNAVDQLINCATELRQRIIDDDVDGASRDANRYLVMMDPSNVCPTCRVVGPFHCHPETDAAIAALPIGCHFVGGTSGASCVWTGRRDELDSHEHFFSEEEHQAQQASDRRGVKRSAADDVNELATSDADTLQRPPVKVFHVDNFDVSMRDCGLTINRTGSSANNREMLTRQLSVFLEGFSGFVSSVSPIYLTYVNAILNPTGNQYPTDNYNDDDDSDDAAAADDDDNHIYAASLITRRFHEMSDNATHSSDGEVDSHNVYHYEEGSGNSGDGDVIGALGDALSDHEQVQVVEREQRHSEQEQEDERGNENDESDSSRETRETDGDADGNVDAGL